jgi:hypothetical protein
MESELRPLQAVLQESAASAHNFKSTVPLTCHTITMGYLNKIQSTPQRKFEVYPHPPLPLDGRDFHRGGCVDLFCNNTIFPDALFNCQPLIIWLTKIALLYDNCSSPKQTIFASAK